jgi:hypothetical protein
MALIAQCIHIGHVEKPRVLRSMGRVAPQTSLSLDHGMLINEGTTRFGMALGADRILIGRGLEVVVPKSAMGIMAVGTLHQAL